MHDEEPRQTKKIGCAKCRYLQRGRLLPARKGWLKCTECGHEVRDRWGLTEGLTPGDFASMAEFARQLRDMKRRHQECFHRRVTVATRPYCSDCGLVLSLDHPLAQRALKRIEGMQETATGPLAEALGKVGG